jgi:hypothetical protein
MKHRRIVLLALASVVVVAVANGSVHALRSHPTRQLRTHSPAVTPDGQIPNSLYLKETSGGHKVTHAMYLRAYAQARKIKTAGNLATGQTAPWTFVGPTNVGGRVDDLALDPTTTPSTVYAAVTSGGVWKSTDNGVNWTVAWPNNLPQSIGALARSSTGALYAGTGESNPSGGGVTIMGAGLFKSTDNGATWQDLGFHDSGAFGRIAVNPSNPNDVFAAATGALSYDSTQRGLYHSTDGGQTWTLTLGTDDGKGDCLNCNVKTGAIDVQIDPVNPNIILASMWDRYRNGGSFYYGGIGSGLYRSTDGGNAWTRLNNTNITGSLCNWDNNDANGTNHTVPATGLDPEGRTSTNDGGLGRIGIAWSSPTAVDPQANRVYIVSAGANGPDKGFYVSDDAGATWHCGGARAGTQNAGYEWVFGRQWVDPANEQHIFDADVSLRVSTNGGNSWGTSSGPHADHHAMIWDPNVPNHVYNGDDGGVYFSVNNGTSWTHATNEGWNQAYHVAVSQQDATRLNQGLQDQGCTRTWRPGVPNANPTQWNSFGGCGDGHWTLINPTNQLQYFGCSQPTPPTINCTRTTDAAVSGSTTSTQTGFTGNPGWGSNARITTDTPITIDPADPAYVYTGGVALVRSGNGVVNSGWTLLSSPTPITEPNSQQANPSLPGVIPLNEINVDTFYANEYGAITFVAPAKSTGTATTPSSTIYVGTDTGLLWKTTNAALGTVNPNVQWTQLGAGVLPQRWVTGIQVDPTDADHVIASFSAYKEGDKAANVWESKDGGATWANISKNLPNAPLWMITFDKTHGLLYASSDFGVFSLYDTNSSANWLKVGQDGSLPYAPVFDTQLTGDRNTLYASVYGRGIWTVAATQDTDAPATTATTAPATANGTNGWFTTSPVQVTLSATDGDGSGVASTQYRVDGGSWTPYTAPFTVSGEGSHAVEYASTDTLGNVEPTRSLGIKIDTVNPATSSSLAPASPTGSNGWYLGPVQVSLSASDATSGVASTWYTIDGGTAQAYSSPFTISADGDHSVRFWSVDAAGNTEPANLVHVLVDQNDPVTTATLNPGLRNGWYASPTLTLSGADGSGSGIAHTDYSLDGGPWTVYSGPLSGFSTGNHFAQYRSTDNAGRVEATKLIAFKVDAVKPSVTITRPDDGQTFPLDKVVTAAFKCVDRESGMDTCVGTVANGANLDTSTVGDHTFTVTATDLAGNVTTVTRHYQVVYTWNGFFAPVTNTETSQLNLVHAGDLVRLGFGLDGDRGLSVLAGGSPTIETIPCPSWTPHSVPAAGAGATSGLSYGTASGHYSYGWQTSSSWAGTCRRFELKLNDGSVTAHSADFMFFS